MAQTTANTDLKMIGLLVGTFLGGVLVGTFLVSPIIKKMMDKKASKKTEATPKA